MTDQTQHTPTPWAVQQQNLYSPTWIVSPERKLIARMGSNFPDSISSKYGVQEKQEMPNARFIVCACNNFEYLYAAAEFVVWAFDNRISKDVKHVKIYEDDIERFRAWLTGCDSDTAKGASND